MPTAREIGALVVDMRADSTQFVRGMARSSDALRRTETRMEATNRSALDLTRVTRRLTLAVAALATAGLGLDRFGREARLIQDTARSLGLDVDSVQNLSRAYRQLGLETIDVRTNLTDLAEALGDARAGNAEFIALFRRAGVDPFAAYQNLYEVLIRIAPLLDEVTGRQIFGEDFDRVRRLLEDLPGYIERTNTGLNRTDEQLSSLISAFEVLERGRTTLEDLGSLIISDPFGAFTRGAEGAHRAWQDLTREIARSVFGVPEEFLNAGVLAPAPSSVPTPGRGRAVPIATPPPQVVDSRAVAFQDQITESLIEQNNQTALLLATYGRTVEDQARITAELEIQTQFQTEQNRLERDLRDARNAPGGPDVRRIEQLEAEQRNLDEIRLRLESYGAALGDAAAETARITENQRIFSEVTDAVGDSLSRFAGDAISGFDSVGDAAQRLLAELIQLALQFALLDPLRRGLEGGFANAGGIFSFFAQHGGVHQGIGVVGEAGPELVNFNSPTQVIPNDQIGQALSGRSGDITVNISGVQDQSAIRATIYDLAPQIEAAVLASVQEDAARQSGLRDAIRGRR